MQQKCDATVTKKESKEAEKRVEIPGRIPDVGDWAGSYATPGW